jgi:F-type H+-transporting ATPase subunit b
MIDFGWSVVPAIIIFVFTVVALNYLLLKPVLRIQEQRESRTSGMMAQTRQSLSHHVHLFEQYQATIKNSRLEAYRLVEKARADAMRYRAEALERARSRAEALTQAAKDSLHSQVAEAASRLNAEAQDLARRITLSVLQRPA